jgi:hypothetical protein
MRKGDFSAVLDWDGFVGHKTLIKDVHHFNLFTEADYDLESTWMQCK